MGGRWSAHSYTRPVCTVGLWKGARCLQVLDLHSKPSTAAVLQGRQLFCWAFPVSEEVLWERVVFGLPLVSCAACDR